MFSVLSFADSMRHQVGAGCIDGFDPILHLPYGCHVPQHAYDGGDAILGLVERSRAHDEFIRHIAAGKFKSLALSPG
jgi:hypothetical protein